MPKYNTELWNQIMELGREKEPRDISITNNFDQYDVETILVTIDFFGATDIWMKQTVFDLYGPPKYRYFDYLAMNVMGRNDDNRKQNEPPLQVLVHSYLKADGVPEDSIQDLRESDYQIDTAWESVVIDKPTDAEIQEYIRAEGDPYGKALD